jgi:hypothetical protein
MIKGKTLGSSEWNCPTEEDDQQNTHTATLVQEILKHTNKNYSHTSLPTFQSSNRLHYVRSFFVIREKLRNGYWIPFDKWKKTKTEKQPLLFRKLLAKKDWISDYYTPSPQIEGFEAFNWQGQDGNNMTVSSSNWKHEGIGFRSVRSTSNCLVRGCELCLLSTIHPVLV